MTNEKEFLINKDSQLLDQILGNRAELRKAFDRIYLGSTISDDVLKVSKITDNNAIEKLRDNGYLANVNGQIVIQDSSEIDTASKNEGTIYQALGNDKVFDAVKSGDLHAIHELYKPVADKAYANCLYWARPFDDPRNQGDITLLTVFENTVDSLPLNDKNYHPNVHALAQLAYNSIEATNLDPVSIAGWVDKTDDLKKITGLYGAFQKVCEQKGEKIIPDVLQSLKFKATLDEANFIMSVPDTSPDRYQGYLHLSDVLPFFNTKRDDPAIDFVPVAKEVKFVATTPEDFNALIGLAQVKRISKKAYQTLLTSVAPNGEILPRTKIDIEAFDHYLVSSRKQAKETVLVASYKDVLNCAPYIKEVDGKLEVDTDLTKKAFEKADNVPDLKSVDQASVESILGQEKSHTKAYEKLYHQLDNTQYLLTFINKEKSISPRIEKSAGVPYDYIDAPTLLDSEPTWQDSEKQPSTTQQAILKPDLIPGKLQEIQTVLAAAIPYERLKAKLYPLLTKRLSRNVDPKRLGNALKGLAYTNAFNRKDQALVLLKEDFQQYGLDPNLVYQSPEEIKEIALSCQSLERQEPETVNEEPQR